jgi:hypothetical protein
MPAHVKQVNHIVAYSQAEFVALFDQASAPVAGLCWRLAAQTLAPAAPAAAEKPAGVSVVTNANTSIGNVTGQTIHVPVTVNVVSGETGKAASIPRKEHLDRKPSAAQEQRSMLAIFGEPPSFAGLSDMEVLKKVKWDPILSGGHSEGSAVSDFRNNFIANYIRAHPTLAFNDSKTQAEVKKKSYLAYKKSNPNIIMVEDPVSKPDGRASKKGRASVTEQVHGVIGKDGVLEVDGCGDLGEFLLDLNEGLDAAPKESNKKRERAEGAAVPEQAKKAAVVERSEEEMLPVATQRNVSGAAQVGKKALMCPVEERLVPKKSAAEQAATAVQGKKRPLQGLEEDEKEEEEEEEEDEGEEEKGSLEEDSDVNLVDEEVNPGKKGCTVKLLKVGEGFHTLHVYSFFSLFWSKAWLAKHGMPVSGSKTVLKDRVGGYLRREQEKRMEQVAMNPVPRKDDDKKSARNAVFVLQQPESIEIGDTLIFASKKQDGQIDTNDEYGLFVVKVEDVETALERPNDKGETDSPKVSFCLFMEDEEPEPHTVNWNAFYILPERLYEFYDKKTLVLFQRSYENNVVGSQLEMGWLKGTFRQKDDSDDPVLVNSVDGESMVDQECIFFDAFGGKKFINDVEIKMALLEIEFSTFRSNMPGDDENE